MGKKKGPIFLFEKRKITICSQCNSVFHTSCYDSAMQTNQKCPICAKGEQQKWFSWKEFDKCVFFFFVFIFIMDILKIGIRDTFYGSGRE